MKRDEILDAGRTFGHDGGIFPDVELRDDQVGYYLSAFLDGLAERIMQDAPTPTLRERAAALPHRAALLRDGVMWRRTLRKGAK